MRARPPPMASTMKCAERRLVSSSSRACTTSVGQRIFGAAFITIARNRSTWRMHSSGTHLIVEILAALELGLDDRAQLLVLDAERVFLFDFHASRQARNGIQHGAQEAIPRCGPAVDVDGRREHDQIALGVTLALREQRREQRAHAHAHQVQGWMLIADLAVFGDDRLDPVLGGDAGEILRFGPVARERQRIGHQSGVLEPLVHRPEVVLRAPEAVDEERRIRRCSGAHAADGRRADDADDAVQIAIVVVDRSRLVDRPCWCPMVRTPHSAWCPPRPRAALAEARSDRVAILRRDAGEPVGERGELLRRQPDQAGRVAADDQLAGLRRPFVGDQPMRADRGLEASLPFACSRRRQRAGPPRAWPPADRSSPARRRSPAR